MVKRFDWTNISAHVLLVIALFFFLSPIFYIASTSFKLDVDIYRNPILPNAFRIENYLVLFNPWDVRMYLPTYVVNSIMAAGISTLIILPLGSLAAYAISRYNVGGKNLFFIILTTRMAPPVVFAIPFYIMMGGLRLLDNVASLVIAYGVMNIALVVWMMRGFFDEIPKDVDEAALIDGWSRFSAFFRIIMPRIYSGVVATAILCLIFAWNEFLLALVLTYSPAAKTIPVYMSGFYGVKGWEWGQMMAAGLLCILPVYIFATVVQRHLVRGLTAGGIRG
jgi:multiple sugar transport system permease protein